MPMKKEANMNLLYYSPVSRLAQQWTQETTIFPCWLFLLVFISLFFGHTFFKIMLFQLFYWKVYKLTLLFIKFKIIICYCQLNKKKLHMQHFSILLHTIHWEVYKIGMFLIGHELWPWQTYRLNTILSKKNTWLFLKVKIWSIDMHICSCDKVQKYNYSTMYSTASVWYQLDWLKQYKIWLYFVNLIILEYVTKNKCTISTLEIIWFKDTQSKWTPFQLRSHTGRVTGCSFNACTH